MIGFLNYPFAEVDHKYQFKKIFQSPGFKNGVTGRYSFTLDKDFSVYYQVDPKIGRKRSSFIKDWKVYLSLNNKIALFKLPNQGFLINTFKQPRPARFTMNLDSRINNVTTDQILQP